MVFSREATGRKVTETDSEKHSHLPQDLIDSNILSHEGKGNKGLWDECWIDIFCHFGTEKAAITSAILRRLCNGKQLLMHDPNLRIEQRCQISWKNFRVGDVKGRIYIDNPLVWVETPHRSRIFRSILL